MPILTKIEIYKNRGEMGKLAVVACILLISAFFCANIYAAPPDNHEFQLWNTDGVSWKFADKWKAALEEEFRFYDDARDLMYRHTDFGITYSGLAKWFDLEANFRQIFEKRSNVWREEDTPHASGIFKFDIEGVSITNRNKFEYRIREAADDFWRYRNTTKLKFPIKLTKLEIQPYASDEFIVDFDKRKMNENRLVGGITLEPFKQVELDLYYMLQSKKPSKDWLDYNALGIKAKVAF